ncbi:DNA polymerase III subunit gamma/tau [Entomomonas asaccharolytica]|uniref:DNA polymerase III subunit gamma/tau n=1 Tax=Entomomonas asaccharolytica TaxID=2785331 RepID=A0A974NGP3_9GAMM|nr:DNA polymerase III subunit gamma/tau [Entomomonas asaccharolytica]QQP86275.1 DNA polymerase III subunit gamma/tau [Entomomonas asaccharolytica]
MSYQVLARKWRPHNFHEMVGQTHVLRALINALDTGRLHHAYLFTGTRGVGKTTISRILTKCLNCEQGVSSTPCGICATCVEIDEGRFIDLIEVDGASRTKVEDTRELLENIQYAPTRGRFKVYLIDEVHMLSSHSFNALLKTLEEPPPHVKFLLATTDPQKLPVTILSRCLQFALKNIAADRIVEHLAHVLEAEKIPYEKEALWLLGRSAQGSMRDAMSLTDQAIAFGGEKVNTADVRDMLGTLDQNQVYELLFALLEGDAKQLLVIIKQLAEQSPDWIDVLAELLNVLHRIAIAQILPDAVDDSIGDKEQIIALAQALPAEDVQFYYQVGLVGRRDLPLAASSQQGFEMVLLRMLAFRPANAERAPITPLKKIEVAQVSEQIPETAEKKTLDNVKATQQTEQVVAKAVEPELKKDVQEVPVAVDAETKPQPIISSPEPLLEKPAITTPAKIEVEQQTTQPKVVAPSLIDEQEDNATESEDEYLSIDEYQSFLDQGFVESDVTTNIADKIDLLDSLPPPATGLAAEWIELFAALKLSGITASIASNCSLISKDNQQWVLQLDPTQQALFSDNQKKRISEAINTYLGHNVNLKIIIEKPAQETPAQREQRKKIELQKAAERAILEDPILQQLMDKFSAKLDEESIKPL